MIPGDPARVLAGTDADAAGPRGDPREVRAQRSDRRSSISAGSASPLRGDLGESIRTRQSVVGTVAVKLPITLELACPVAPGRRRHRDPGRRASPRCAATRRGTCWPAASSLVRRLRPELLAGDHADPARVGAAGLAARLGLRADLRRTRSANLKRMIMPALVLGTGLAAVLMRQTRNSDDRGLSADYIRTARSQGAGQPRGRVAPRAPQRTRSRS